MREATQLNQAPKVRTTLLPSGRAIPVLGQGTWRMGEEASRFQSEVAALRYGLDLGMNLIDTAEMYGEGGAEEVVAEAIAGQREEVFVVSKVYPHNATRRGAIEACERSLQRLKTDYIDLYLLHWRGDVALGETVAAFQELKEAGKIFEHGVSNFDVSDMEEWVAISGGEAVASNQVLYNLTSRGIEWELIPWSRDRSIPIMAYSPVGHRPDEQKRVFDDHNLKLIAAAHGVTPTQIALAWVLRAPDIIAIPKASRPEHIRQNRAALDIKLSNDDLEKLDQSFRPPHRKTPLEML